MEDTRNVIDYYKGWETEAIKADLDTKRTPLINMCCNLTGDFNKSSVIRASNAFGASKTIIAGKRKWDKRGAVGTHHYEHIEYWDDPIVAIEWYIAEGYRVFPVDNTPEYDPIPINFCHYPTKTMFVYGEEQLGLSKELIIACNEAPIFIDQRGSVRSLNVAQAAAVCMFEYSRQNSNYLYEGHPV